MWKKKSKWYTMIGVFALCLLAVIFGLSIWKNRNVSAPGKEKEARSVELIFEPEELVYDGQGELDLMKGVRAVAADGKDLTDKVSAVLTGEGNQTNKIVRYSVFDEQGNETTKRRNLKFTDYEGPVLQISEHLNLQAENMTDLTSHLAEQGLLRVEDGFGKEATEEVTWMREKVAKGKYDITFSYTNAYQDSVEKTVSADVSGELKDLSVKLRTNSVDLPVGTEFVAEDYIEEIDDPSGNASRVNVTSQVDVMHAGTYHVQYEIISTDSTQKTTAVLKVNIK